MRNLVITNSQVSSWLEENAESKHAAVYAVVGKDGTVSFVGVSRNVALSLAAHIQNEGEDKVHSVKVRAAILRNMNPESKCIAGTPKTPDKGLLLSMLVRLVVYCTTDWRIVLRWRCFHESFDVMARVIARKKNVWHCSVLLDRCV